MMRPVTANVKQRVRSGSQLESRSAKTSARSSAQKNGYNGYADENSKYTQSTESFTSSKSNKTVGETRNVRVGGRGPHTKNGYGYKSNSAHKQTESTESFASNISSVSMKRSDRRTSRATSASSSRLKARNRRSHQSVDDLTCSLSDWSEAGQGDGQGPLHTWDTFKQEINNIDDCSSMFTGNNAVQLRARSSDAFNKVNLPNLYDECIKHILIS